MALVTQGDFITSINPSTGQELSRFRSSSDDDVHAAVEAAKAAAVVWAETPPAVRMEVLLEVAQRIEENFDEFVIAVVDEVGKPVREAREEVARGVAIVRYQATAGLDPSGTTIPSPGGDAFVYTIRRPLGQVGLITPWNFPVAIPLWKLAPALAYGNVALLKPAPQATGVARLLEQQFASVPTDVVTMLPGGIETGQALARAPLRALSFTGSTAAGTAVAHEAIRTGARFQAEMGGKNASVVLVDADLELATTTIAAASMGYAGQKCTATSRVIVEERIADRFADLLTKEIRSLRVGNPADEETDVGPLIEPSAVARVSDFVERALAAGAQLVLGGRALPELGECFFEPTLVADVEPDAELTLTEVFGPVLVLLRARDADEALALANRSPYGLAAAVFTRDLDRGLRFADRLEAGVVRVNGPTPGVLLNAPFGPTKASGIGFAEQGKAARDFFTEERTVSVVGRRGHAGT
jgi:acyl-CoA reductase-like NAD-dependent aldehyde dehydrogenase